ncbi:MULTISPECIES: hypothetical protein [Sphingobacterium]|uniref:Uncharacterized protein n=1 Tax=Sphingobacterium tenebrionis TaxID=3111775 RepID=A0ABU8I409_9SPHI|nr:hypothetical protein [Sphingobacterium sp. CZ-2]QBR11476.1 hypothetical protein E3D81_04520 [Sphingobacterium sp. CZ-2]
MEKVDIIEIKKPEVISILTIDRPLKRSLIDYILRREPKIKKESFEITSTKLGVRIRYAQIMRKMDSFTMSESVDMMSLGLFLSSEHVENLVYAMAVLVVNDPFKSPPKWLCEQLKKMNEVEFNLLKDVLLKALDMPSFIQSIVILKGLGLTYEENGDSE